MTTWPVRAEYSSLHSVSTIVKTVTSTSYVVWKAENHAYVASGKSHRTSLYIPSQHPLPLISLSESWAPSRHSS